MQFGSKPLFENISVKFGGGNRYGLIGANGSGKSTFMKILGGDLEPTLGNVSLDPNERIGKLRQDQFAFEEFTVLDTVIMGHKELWEVKQERDRIYALPEMSEEDGYKVADLEVKYGEMDGYSAEARAGELLLGVGIPVEQHYGPMSEVAPGWKLRVLLAQALFADPDILLLDEPTNNLDIDTIRWLEQVLNERDSTMIIISHDRHFLNMVCTHMADLDYYPKGTNTVIVLPIGIGQLGKDTPINWTTKVERKKAGPTWTPTAKMHAEYRAAGEPLPAVVPAGPDNPMGLYALYIGRLYAIHGTNANFGIGLRVSHGCVRLRNEDIKFLFEKVPVGTRVQFIDEPVKATTEPDGSRYIEVHNPLSTTEAQFEGQEIVPITLTKSVQTVTGQPDVDQVVLDEAIKNRSGMPVRLN
jgi:ABC-type multidrug transport system ATPase subunit